MYGFFVSLCSFLVCWLCHRRQRSTIHTFRHMFGGREHYFISLHGFLENLYVTWLLSMNPDAWFCLQITRLGTRFPWLWSTRGFPKYFLIAGISAQMVKGFLVMPSLTFQVLGNTTHAFALKVHRMVGIFPCAKTFTQAPARLAGLGILACQEASQCPCMRFHGTTICNFCSCRRTCNSYHEGVQGAIHHSYHKPT